MQSWPRSSSLLLCLFLRTMLKIDPSNLVPRSHSDLGTRLRPISPAQVANQNKVLASSSHIINSVNNSNGEFFGGYYIALPITKKWIKPLTSTIHGENAWWNHTYFTIVCLFLLKNNSATTINTIVYIFNKLIGRYSLSLFTDFEPWPLIHQNVRRKTFSQAYNEITSFTGGKPLS